MTALQVKLQRLAKEDLRDAYVRYEIQTPGLGADFLHEVTTALRKAANQTSLYPIVDRELGVRRVLVKRFPYKALFTVELSRIIVHGIIHTSRSDESWEGRF